MDDDRKMYRHVQCTEKKRITTLFVQPYSMQGAPEIKTQQQQEDIRRQELRRLSRSSLSLCHLRAISLSPLTAHASTPSSHQISPCISVRDHISTRQATGNRERQVLDYSGL